MRASFLKSVRLFHLYSGVFLAPAILFFATTGGLQMFSLHETTRGSSYKPPALLVSLGQIHKKGTYMLPQRRQPPAAVAPGKPDGDKPDAAKPEPPKGPNPLPFKIFAAITAIGLILSTLTGLIMSWKYTRRKILIVALFFAGILIPIFLLAI